MEIKTELKITIKDVTISMTVEELYQLKAELDKITSASLHVRYPWFYTLCATNNVTSSGTVIVDNINKDAVDIKLL